MSAISSLNRCAYCMQPHSAHIKRMEAAPLCMNGAGVFREATEEELAAGYLAAFPDGPKPIATFHVDNPADMERAKAILSPAALNGFFGPGGGGMSAFMEAMEASGKSA